MLAPSVPDSRYRRAVFWREQSVAVGRDKLAGRLYAPASVPDEAGLVVHLHGGTFDSGSLERTCKSSKNDSAAARAKYSPKSQM